MPSAGRVVAVCTSPRTGVPKPPQPVITVGAQGVEGDFHAGPINRHKKAGPPEPNRRQVSIIAREATDAVSAALGIRLRPGDLAENVLVEGLGDLSQLQPGDRLRLGERVVVEVTGQNKPCKTLAVHHPDIVAAFTGRRGVVAVVIATGEVRPGDGVEVTRTPALEAIDKEAASL